MCVCAFVCLCGAVFVFVLWVVHEGTRSMWIEREAERTPPRGRFVHMPRRVGLCVYLPLGREVLLG